MCGFYSSDINPGQYEQHHGVSLDCIRSELEEEAREADKNHGDYVDDSIRKKKHPLPKSRHDSKHRSPHKTGPIDLIACVAFIHLFELMNFEGVLYFFYCVRHLLARLSPAFQVCSKRFSKSTVCCVSLLSLAVWSYHVAKGMGFRYEYLNYNFSAFYNNSSKIIHISFF